MNYLGIISLHLIILQFHIVTTKETSQNGVLSWIAANVLNIPVKTPTWKDGETTFATEMSRLKRNFPSQKMDTWYQLSSTIGNTLKEKPPQHPAVVTALYPPAVSTEFSICLSKTIGMALNKAVCQVFPNTNFKSNPPFIITNTTFLKYSITEIRQKLKTYLTNEGKAVLVLGVENFKNSDELMMFHGICDNYHAVDARATIIFPVSVPMNTYLKYKEWNHKMGGLISNEVLTEAWENVLEPNTLPALIARVADAVILINDGDECLDSSNINKDAEDNSVADNTDSNDLPKQPNEILRKIEDIQNKMHELEKNNKANSQQNIAINSSLTACSNDILLMEKRIKTVTDNLLTWQSQVQDKLQGLRNQVISMKGQYVSYVDLKSIQLNYFVAYVVAVSAMFVLQFYFYARCKPMKNE